MPELRIETERLVLRDWRGDDVAPIHAICSDPQVMATIGPLMDRDAARGLVDRLGGYAERYGHTFWALERRADGRMIGFCGVSRGAVPAIEGRLEIGWRLASDCWGQSYAREAAEATLDWIGGNRPAEPIFAITSVGNIRSRGLMERLGLRYCEGMDFDHPMVADGSPLKRHITYRMDPVP
jgi:RimJ/RimL family protein N-acetyltransferase